VKRRICIFRAGYAIIDRCRGGEFLERLEKGRIGGGRKYFSGVKKFFKKILDIKLKIF